MRKGMKKVLSLLLAVVLLPVLLLPPSAAWAGGGDAHEHAWAGVFAADSEYHWRMCMADSECDIRNPREMMDFGPHVYDSSGNCVVCKYPKSGLESSVRPVDAVLINGPIVMVGVGATPISCEGLGYDLVGASWGADFTGLFKQAVTYTLTVDLRAHDNYVFASDFSGYYYNNFHFAGMVNYTGYIETVGDVVHYRDAHVQITFTPTDPLPVSGLKAVSAGMNRVDLSWDASPTCDGYIILRNGNQIGYTFSNSYTDKSADSGKFNFYWVIPFSKYAGKTWKGQVGGYVYALGRTVDKVKNVRAISAAVGGFPGAKISWDPAQGANSYVLVSRTGKSGPLNLPVEISAREFEDAGNSGDLMFYWVYGVYRDSNGHVLCAGPMSDYAWAVLLKK